MKLYIEYREPRAQTARRGAAIICDACFDEYNTLPDRPGSVYFLARAEHPHGWYPQSPLLQWNGFLHLCHEHVDEHLRALDWAGLQRTPVVR